MATFEDGCYGSLKGIALIGKVLAGRCKMRYTRVAAGKGEIPEGVSPKSLTEPPDYVMDAMISSVTNPVDGECQVSVQINSSNVESGFYVKGLLLYAEDPDEGEIPYTYLNLQNEPEWIRPSSSIVGKLAHFDIIAAVGDVEEVYASIDPDALVTLESVHQLIAEHDKDTRAHQGILRTVENLQQKLGGGIVRAERLELNIPAGGWEPDEDTGGAYSFHRDIAHTKIREDMVPVVTLLPLSLETARACQFCNTAQTLSGALRIYAKSVPSAEISISLVLIGDVRSLDEIIIPTMGWVPDEDTAGKYPLHIDILCDSAEEELVPLLTILPAYLETAGACGMCPDARTMDGILRIYAKSVPAAPIHASLALLGVTQSITGNIPWEGGDAYELPVATRTQLGMVKLGEGLTGTPDGTVSVNRNNAKAKDIEDMLGEVYLPNQN